MEREPVINKWVKLWTPLLGKTYFTDQEAHHLTLKIRLSKTPPEVHGSWNGHQLMATTITEAWARAREVFGELWMKDILMTDADL